MAPRKPVEGEGDGDQQAAGHDEREHVGNARHQVLVDALERGAGPGSFVPPGRLRRRPGGGLASGRSQGCGGGQGGLDHVGTVLQGVFGAGLVEPLAGEAGQVDLGVGGHDHGVGGGDLLGGEDVLGPHRALGLDLDPVAEILGCLPQAFGGHEGVGDAGGAGGDRHQALGCDLGGHPRGGGAAVPGGGRTRLRSELGGIGQDGLDDGGGVANGLRRGGGVERLAGEPGRVHVDVGRQDDRVGAGDGLRRERMADAVGALGLHLDVMAHHLGLAAERLGRHHRVGHPGGAGRHRHESHGLPSCSTVMSSTVVSTSTGSR
jgi:hypothetical protein